MTSPIGPGLALAVLAAVSAPLASASQRAGAVTVSVATSDGPLSLTATDYTAGVICFITWNGREFLDAKDHGRCLQSAVSFDSLGEVFNPTEGGASIFSDGLLPRPSSSRVLNSVASATTLHTETQMAFWFPVNGQRRSGHIVRKYVQAGWAGSPNVISYQIEFEVPAGEVHGIGQFEFLTAYMPLAFGAFYAWDPVTGSLAPLGDGPGEQPRPVVFATADGRHAMGVWSPDDPARLAGGYGRWRFADCVKWNMVARVPNPQGTLRFHAYLVIGSLAQVRSGLADLVRSVPATPP